MTDLGAIPVMSPSYDEPHDKPDERIMITSVAYLYNRLIELKQEVRAASIIQRAWRLKNKEKQKLVRRSIGQGLVCYIPKNEYVSCLKFTSLSPK